MSEGVEIKNLKIPIVKGERGISIRDLEITDAGDLIVHFDNETRGNAGNINKISKASIVDGQLIIETTGGETYNAGNICDDELIQARIDKFNKNAEEKSNEFDKKLETGNQDIENLARIIKEEIRKVSQDEKEEIASQTNNIYEKIKIVEDNTNNKLGAKVDEQVMQEEIGKLGHRLELEMEENTFILTVKLLDKNNNILSTKQIDLPLETMVVGGTYNSENRNIILTLKNGQEVSFNVADLVTGLVSETTFTTAMGELEGRLQAKLNAINTKLETIDENAQANVIERILVNGVEQQIGEDKSVNIEVSGGSGGGNVEISTGRVILEAETEIISDYEVILPINYTVGNNSLELYWDGWKLIKSTSTQDGQYKEVGEDGQISNKIRFHRTDDDGNYIISDNVVLEAVVIGINTEQGGV